MRLSAARSRLRIERALHPHRVAVLVVIRCDDVAAAIELAAGLAIVGISVTQMGPDGMVQAQVPSAAAPVAA